MHPRSTLRVKVFEHAFLTKTNNEHIVCGRMRAYIVVEDLIEGIPSAIQLFYTGVQQILFSASLLEYVM